MQVIEYGEKGILRFFCSVEKLHIINNQHIDQLIKMDKVIDGIIAAVIDKLVYEFLRAHIQNHFIVVGTTHFVAYCLGEMCFTKPHAAVNYQGIKRIGSRFFRNRLTGPSRHPVTCLLYTSDAADEEDSVDLGGRRIIKK